MLELDLHEAGFEAMELYFQIDALRREIDAMRMKRMTRESTNFGPEWMKSPWHPADPAPPKSGAGCEVQVDALLRLNACGKLSPAGERFKKRFE